MRKSLIALAAIPALLVALAGCTPAGNGASATPPTKAVTEKDWWLAHDKCLRDAGMDVGAADGGGQSFQAGGSSPEKVLQAMDDCTAKVTDELGERPVSEQDREKQDAWAETNDCLRKQGVEVKEGAALDPSAIPENVRKACGVADPAVVGQ